MKKAFFLLLFCTNLAFADKIFLKNGNALEGKFIGQVDSTITFEVWLGRKIISLEFQQSKVDSMVTGTETKNDKLLKELKVQLDSLDRKNPNDWFELGIWCRKNRHFEDEAQECFYKALEVDPHHQLALMELGLKQSSPRAIRISYTKTKPSGSSVPSLDAGNFEDINSLVGNILNSVLSGSDSMGSGTELNNLLNQLTKQSGN
ncbi:hypothetical protein IT568_07485 [bacterium]|nr:hypothetical protein [bacterium]